MVYFEGTFPNFPNSDSESWVKTGVNTKVNLRIARKATLEVLFQGKIHHTDKVLLLWNQLYWQSCSLYCFSNTSPWSAHTWNKLSNQKHALPASTRLHRGASAGTALSHKEPPLLTLHREDCASRSLWYIHGLILAELVYSSTFVKVLVMLSIVWHSAVREPQPLNVSLSINPC